MGIDKEGNNCRIFSHNQKTDQNEPSEQAHEAKPGPQAQPSTLQTHQTHYSESVATPSKMNDHCMHFSPLVKISFYGIEES